MNAPFVTQAADGHPRRKFSNAEILRMVEAGVIDPDERFELIRGEIVPMAPEMDPHFRARSRLSRLLMRTVDETYLVGSEGSLFLAEDVELKPDLWVFDAKLKSHDVRGPDVLLAIEIASTTQARDFGLKVPIYAEHGVRELWVLDLKARAASVFRQTAAEGYGEPARRAADETLEALHVPGVRVRLADLLA